MKLNAIFSSLYAVTLLAALCVFAGGWLREVAGRLLREAPAFKRLLADLRSER